MTTSSSDKAERSGDSYHIYNPKDTSIGYQAVTFNISGGDAQQAALILARTLTEQRHRLLPEQVAALEAQLRQLQAQMDKGFVATQAGQAALSAQLQTTAAGLQAVLLARLDAQERRLIEEILTVLESGAVAADELDRHLAVIEEAVGRAQTVDPATQAAVLQAQELLSAPGLDVQSKLKLTVPLIPFFLQYEGELGLGQQVNLAQALAAVWQAMRGWVGQRK